MGGPALHIGWQVFMTRSTRPHPILRVALGVCAAILVLGGCGDGEPADQVSAGGPAQDAGASLPTLPPIDERHPEQFGPDGCAATSSGSECSVTADAIDANQASAGESGWRVLEGFVGPRWTTTVGGSVRVLDDTLTVGLGPTWSALGLVRNERAEAVGPVTVRATLFDAGGATLGTLSAEALVPVLRPGEPAPFELASDVPLGDVASVQWSVDEAPVADAGPNRSLELGVLWQRGLADPRPVDLYLFRDPTSGPHPFVVFGSATNVGDAAVASAAAVGAWLDPDGRVLAIARATVVRPEGVALAEDGPDRAGEIAREVVGPSPAPTLEPGETADVLLVLDATGAPAGVDEAQLALWGTGT